MTLGGAGRYRIGVGATSRRDLLSDQILGPGYPILRFADIPAAKPHPIAHSRDEFAILVHDSEPAVSALLRSVSVGPQQENPRPARP
jgi:hypothetical protein